MSANSRVENFGGAPKSSRIATLVKRHHPAPSMEVRAAKACSDLLATVFRFIPNSSPTKPWPLWKTLAQPYQLRTVERHCAPTDGAPIGDYLIRDCVVTTGSFLGAWLWSISPQANFIGAAVCGALGTVWFWWFVFRQRRRVEGMVV